MKTTEEILITLVEFSAMFNLTPPRSNDIKQWWYQVVKEMEIHLLYLIRDSNLFVDGHNLVWMHDIVMHQINVLEIAI